MVARRPAPAIQGELDALCGLYSVVNALQWVLHTANIATLRRPLNSDERQALFNKLAIALGTRRPLAEFMAAGIGSSDLSRLLRVSREWVFKHRNAALESRRPFYRRRTVPMPRVVRLLTQHLSMPGSAVIVGFEPPLSHWTVITGLSATRIRLHDSGGRVYLPVNAIDYRGRGRPNGVRPYGIFLLRLLPAADARAKQP